MRRGSAGTTRLRAGPRAGGAPMLPGCGSWGWGSTDQSRGRWPRRLTPGHLAAPGQVLAGEDPGVAQGVKVLAVDERCRDVRAALLLLPSDLGAAGDVAACAAADDENGGFGAPPAGHHDQAIGVGRRGRGNLRTASQPPQLFPGGGVIT